MQRRFTLWSSALSDWHRDEEAETGLEQGGGRAQESFGKAKVTGVAAELLLQLLHMPQGWTQLAAASSQCQPAPVCGFKLLPEQI